MVEGNMVSAAAVFICAIAAFTDTRTGLIPNWLTFPVIIGAPLVHGWTLGPGALLRSVVALLLCGLMPYLMFRRGGMGGGDVKLFAAIGAVAGLGFGLQVELISMLAASLWGLGVLAFRGKLFAVLLRSLQLLCVPLMPKRWRAVIDEEHVTHIRLGLPIALATCVCAAMQAFPNVGAFL